jgi:hypothetical protein
MYDLLYFCVSIFRVKTFFNGLEIIQFPFPALLRVHDKSCCSEREADIFPPTYCLNCALVSASPHQKPFAAGRWSLEPGLRHLCDERAATCVSRHGIYFFGSGRENNAVPARVDLYKFYQCIYVYVCAGCSAVAMVR